MTESAHQASVRAKTNAPKGSSANGKAAQKPASAKKPAAKKPARAEPLNSPFFAAVCTEFGPDRPIGPPVDEFDDFFDLEAELMKRGSLTQQSIDWTKLGEVALRLLGKQSKDWRLVEVLCAAYLHPGTIEGYCQAVDAALAFAELYPAANPLSAKVRLAVTFRTARQFDVEAPRHGKIDPTIIKNCELSLKALQSFDQIFNKDALGCFERAGKNLKMLASGKELPASGEDMLANGQPLQSSPAAANSTAQGADTQTANANAPKEVVHIDPTSERTVKKSLLNVADFIQRSYPSVPLSYQIRRFATWNNITGYPPEKREGRTEIFAVSVDTSASYLESLAQKSVTHDLFLRLERILCDLPFWLEGHFIADQFACQLECFDVSATIRAETASFAARFPKLRKLSFSDGGAIIPETTLSWLESLNRQNQQAASEAESFQFEVSGDDAGMQRAFKELEQRLSSASSPREQIYAQLSLAEYHHKSENVALAGSQALGLWQQVKETSVFDWEPGIAQRLSVLTGRPEASKYEAWTPPDSAKP